MDPPHEPKPRAVHPEDDHEVCRSGSRLLRCRVSQRGIGVWGWAREDNSGLRDSRVSRMWTLMIAATDGSPNYRYPPFMTRKSGLVKQLRVWDETREELKAKVPELEAVYKMLDGR